MVQHVFIKEDANGKPVVDITKCNIWRDDQQVMWKFDTPNWGWDNDSVNGPNRAIEFDANGAPWQGSIPAPIGLFPESGLDQRWYSAMGPGPNPGPGEQVFSYLLYVVDRNGNKQQIVDIDPEIGNQPQP